MWVSTGKRDVTEENIRKSLVMTEEYIFGFDATYVILESSLPEVHRLTRPSTVSLQVQ